MNKLPTHIVDSLITKMFLSLEMSEEYAKLTVQNKQYEIVDNSDETDLSYDIFYYNLRIGTISLELENPEDWIVATITYMWSVNSTTLKIVGERM